MEDQFWEKVVRPPQDQGVSPARTFPERTLESGQFVKGAYDPRYYEETLKGMEGQIDEFVVYPPPLFIMSPRTKIYLVEDIRHFKGYLNKFTPSQNSEGEPEMEVTITITEDVK